MWLQPLAIDDNTVVSVKSAAQFWLADTQLLNWRQAGDASPDPQWVISEPAPDGLQQAVTAAYRGGGPSLERLLLELHSGRIFGTIGVLVYDLLALALGFLSISGLILWFRSPRNGKSK